MMNRGGIVLSALLLSSPAVAELTLDDLACGPDLPQGVELRVTYGPFWDGAWRLSIVRDAESPTPVLKVETLEVVPADFRVMVLERHRRPSNDPDLRLLRQASGTMIAEMRALGEDRPELRSEQRPLVIQLAGTEGTACVAGFANWPRLPGTYYFQAVDLLRAAVVQPEVTRDPWTAARLQLRQVRPAWR